MKQKNEGVGKFYKLPSIGSVYTFNYCFSRNYIWCTGSFLDTSRGTYSFCYTYYYILYFRIKREEFWNKSYLFREYVYSSKLVNDSWNTKITPGHIKPGLDQAGFLICVDTASGCLGMVKELAVFQDCGKKFSLLFSIIP